MNREVARGRAEHAHRRSSVHFNYDSEDPDPPADSPSPAITVKTTHFASQPDSLSAFELPIFHGLALDSRRKHPPEPQLPTEQEQFWSFLEKFGREGESGSEGVDFEEEATVFYGTSTEQRNSKSKRNSRSKPRLGLAGCRPSGPLPISETEEHGTSANRPRPTFAVAATQTVAFPTFRRRKPRQRAVVEADSQLAENAELPISCSRNLTFREFREAENEDDRRYPARATRDCGRLKFWQCERIDYARGGFWLQKEDE